VLVHKIEDKVKGLVSRNQGLGFGDEDVEIRVQDARCKVWQVVSGVQG
jgi:hypothetical protein